MSAMTETLEKLSAEVEELKSRIAVLENGETPDENDDTILLRTVAHEEGKQGVLELFLSEKGPLYFSDIANRLRLDLPLVVELCQELIEEQEIEVDDSI